MLVKLHFVKCCNVLEFLLNETLLENEFEASETLILMKKIMKCKKCASQENLCSFHSKLVKTSILNDVDRWIKASKMISNGDKFRS